MNLTKSSIKELQNILKKDYGVSLNEEEVDSFGVSLLEIVYLLFSKEK